MYTHKLIGVRFKRVLTHIDELYILYVPTVLVHAYTYRVYYIILIIISTVFTAARTRTCMSAFVDFEILGSGEYLAASLERARERFLAGVHPDVVDQLVLGLERPALALATVPEARVRRALGPTDVLDRDVRHNVLHGAEHFAASAHRRPRFVDPQARHVLERGGRGRDSRHGHAVPHVPVERTAAAGRTVVAAAATRAVRVLRAAVVVVVPVHGSNGRGRDGRLRRRRVHLAVVVMVVMVRLQVVVHAGVQPAEVVLARRAVLPVVMAMVVVVHVPADLQKVSGPRVPGMVRRRSQRRLPVPVHVVVLVLRRSHVIVLDLDAHAVGQRRVVHKRV